MIDFHCHILPGLDDGAITIDDSLAMARSLSAFGYKSVCCTPHCIKGYYDLTSEKVREATLRLQADIDNADIDLQIWPGMEYMLDECFAEFAEDLQPLAVTRLILCEAPQLAHPGFVQEGLELIIEKGFVPLIAHPERTQYFYEILKERETWDGELQDEENHQKQSSLLKRFWPFTSRDPRSSSQVSKMSSSRVPRPAFPELCLFQANLGSFTNYYGPHVQRRAYEFLKQGVYTALASDLHDNSSAHKVLAHDKFEINPLLKTLSAWDGFTLPAEHTDKPEEGAQGELF